MIKWITFVLMLTLVGLEVGATIAYHMHANQVRIVTGGVRG